jgi:Major Facilitator Superfamily
VRLSGSEPVTLLQGNLVGSILALSFAVIGIASATPLFFALISEYLSVGAAAGGIALISCLGNLGPAVSPTINGFILRNTGDNIYSMYFVMALYLLSGTLLLLEIRHRRRAFPAGRRRIDGDWEKQLAGSLSSASALQEPSRPGGRLSRDNRGREAALRDRANRSRADYVVQYSIDHQQQEPPLPALARIFEIAHQILRERRRSRGALGAPCSNIGLHRCRATSGMTRPYGTRPEPFLPCSHRLRSAAAPSLS